MYDLQIIFSNLAVTYPCPTSLLTTTVIQNNRIHLSSITDIDSVAEAVTEGNINDTISGSSTIAPSPEDSYSNRTFYWIIVIVVIVTVIAALALITVTVIVNKAFKRCRKKVRNVSFDHQGNSVTNNIYGAKGQIHSTKINRFMLYIIQFPTIHLYIVAGYVDIMFILGYSMKVLVLVIIIAIELLV